MTDAELLDRLRTSLIPPATAAVEPPAASVGLLLASVRAASQPVPVAPRRRLVVQSWARRVAAAGAALTVIGGGAGVAFAAGAPVPAAVRDAAHGLGLPVDSSAVVAARGALRALSDAEIHGNPTSIAARAEALRAKLARLEGADHDDLARQSAPALAAASRGTAATGDEGTGSVEAGASNGERETPAKGQTTSSTTSPDGRSDIRPAGQTPPTTEGESGTPSSPPGTKTPSPDDQHPRSTSPPTTSHRN